MGERRSRPPGRPAKILDQDMLDRLEKAVKLGVPVSLACQSAGISESGFYNWMQRGYAEAEARSDPEEGEEPNPEEQPYLDLFLMVTQARAEAALRNVGVIQKVAQGGTVIEDTVRTYRDENGEEVVEKTVKRQPPDWRAAAWYLERAHRSEYGKGADQVEVSGPGGGPVQLSGNEAESLAERLAANVTAAIAAARNRDSEPADVRDAEIVDG